MVGQSMIYDYCQILARQAEILHSARLTRVSCNKVSSILIYKD